MGVVVSSLLFTKADIAGVLWTEGWFVAEFRDTGGATSGLGYQGGGELFDLTAYYRRLEHWQALPLSGVSAYRPEPNYTDVPTGFPGSARIRLMGMGISGVVVNILSGQIAFQSGAILSAQVSGQVFLKALSGALQADVGTGTAPTELVSGIAISGTRILLHTLGF